MECRPAPWQLRRPTGSGFPIDVYLRPEWVANLGYRYDVLLDREVIVHGSRDPEHDAARALQARGLRGPFRIVDFHTGTPRMILDIEKAAGLRIERADSGLIVVSYRPMSEEDKIRARLQRACQGGRVPGRAVPGGRLPDKRDGGERGATARRVLPPADADGSRAHTSHQGRTVPTEVVCGAGQPAKATRGQTCAGSRRMPESA